MNENQLRLYGTYLLKLAALRDENAKHDFSPEGNNRYCQALVECKQAYRAVADEDQRLYDVAQKVVYPSGQSHAR